MSKANEKEIRAVLFEWIKENYPKHIIREEHTQWGQRCRPDVFCIGDDNEARDVLIAFEIKSDRDVLKNLKHQLKSYPLYSTGSYAVLDKIHLEKYKDINTYLTYEAGLLVYDDGVLYLKKKPSFNGLPHFFDFLWTAEMKQLLKFKGRAKIASDVGTLRYLCQELYTYCELYDLSKKIYLHRVRVKNVCPISKDEILNYEEKQAKFTKALSLEYFRSKNPFSWSRGKPLLNDLKQKFTDKE